MNSASARASSVLPTPVGPRNRNVPIGRSGSCRPARERRSAFDDGLDRLVLADDALVQALLHVDELLDLALQQARDRDAGPLARRPRRSSSASTSSERKTGGSARRRLARLGLGELLLELGDLAVAQLGGALVVELALGALELACAPRRGARCSSPWPSACSFSRSHCALHAAPTCSRSSASSRSISSRALGGASSSLPTATLLDLELHDAALDLVDLGRHRVDLDAHARGGLVDQVDRLVGQEAVGDVAVATASRRRSARRR